MKLTNLINEVEIPKRKVNRLENDISKIIYSSTKAKEFENVSIDVNAWDPSMDNHHIEWKVSVWKKGMNLRDSMLNSKTIHISVYKPMKSSKDFKSFGLGSEQFYFSIDAGTHKNAFSIQPKKSGSEGYATFDEMKKELLSSLKKNVDKFLEVSIGTNESVNVRNFLLKGRGAPPKILYSYFRDNSKDTIFMVTGVDGNMITVQSKDNINYGVSVDQFKKLVKNGDWVKLKDTKAAEKLFKESVNEADQKFKRGDEIEYKQLFGMGANQDWVTLKGVVAKVKNKKKTPLGRPNPYQELILKNGSVVSPYNNHKDIKLIESALIESVNEAYDIGMARKGNGIVVYNKAEEENNDYKKVAHIDNKGNIKYHDKKLPPKIKKTIEVEAKKMMEIKSEGTKMKLKGLLNESSVQVGKVYSNPYAKSWVKEEDERQSTEEMTEEQRSAFLEAVKGYRTYGESVYRKEGLTKVYESIRNMVEVANKVTLSETGDWFDGVTVGRHMKRMNESFKVFERTLKEVSTLQQRLESSYDEIGEVLGKYYEINELEEGNEFGAARAKAIAAGKSEFEVDGKTYKVTGVDKEDKENAKKFANEGKTMKLTDLLNESYGIGELPSSKLKKMKMTLGEIMNESIKLSSKDVNDIEKNMDMYNRGKLDADEVLSVIDEIIFGRIAPPGFKESAVNEGASTEEKRIVMMAVRKLAKYRGVSIVMAMNDLLRAADDVERDIQKGKIKK